MAINNHETLTSLFSDIANSIRGKTGDTNVIVADTFPNAIDSIYTGTNTEDATARANDILYPKTAYANGQKIEGTIPTKTDTDVNIAGANITVPAGYYAVNVSKSINTVTHPAPTINKATFNNSSLNVEITTNHAQSTGYVVGNTTSVSGNVPIPSGSVSVNNGTLSIPAPNLNFNATTGIVTSESKSNILSVSPNITEGYIKTGVSGTITGTVASNTINVGIAQINTISGNKTLDKPTFNFNNTTGVITATVADTTATAYGNVNRAGYTPKEDKSGTVSITGNSNTFNLSISNQTVVQGTATGPTVTGYVNGTEGYTNNYNIAITGTVANGTINSGISHSVNNPSVTVSHNGNIANIATVNKPNGTVGTDYFQIGFSNSITQGNTNARGFANVTSNGYLTSSNNTASS